MATIKDVAALSGVVMAVCTLKGYEIAAKLPKKLVEEKIRDVSIGFDEKMLHLFDIETGNALAGENVNMQVDQSACCM